MWYYLSTGTKMRMVRKSGTERDISKILLVDHEFFGIENLCGDKIEAAIKKLGYRPATPAELIYWESKKKWNEKDQVIALNVRKKSGSRKPCARLWRSYTGDVFLTEERFYDFSTWEDNDKFLIVCNP